MAEAKRKPARKSSAKKTARKSTAKTTTKTAATRTEETTSASTDAQGGPVRVPAGGIDPRLAEEREIRRAAESGIAFATAAVPATLDPKLAEIRERTKQREAELSGRSLRKPPARG